MLDLRRDVDDRTRRHLHRLLAPRLIPAAPADTDEQLPTARLGMIDMPVIAAAGLERHVMDDYLTVGNSREIALAIEKFAIRTLAETLPSPLRFFP